MVQLKGWVEVEGEGGRERVHIPTIIMIFLFTPNSQDSDPRRASMVPGTYTYESLCSKYKKKHLEACLV